MPAVNYPSTYRGFAFWFLDMRPRTLKYSVGIIQGGIPGCPKWTWRAIDRQSRNPDKAWRTIGLDYIIKSKLVELATPCIILNADNFDRRVETIRIL